MITNDTPVLRAELADSITATPHLQEGKLAKLDAQGKIAPATGTDDALGIIANPDGQTVAACGQPTSADLVLHTFGGIIQVQLHSGAAAVAPGTKLYAAAGGTFSTTAAGSPAATAVESAAAGTAGQLVRAILTF